MHRQMMAIPALIRSTTGARDVNVTDLLLQLASLNNAHITFAVTAIMKQRVLLAAMILSTKALAKQLAKVMVAEAVVVEPGKAMAKTVVAVRVAAVMVAAGTFLLLLRPTTCHPDLESLLIQPLLTPTASLSATSSFIASALNPVLMVATMVLKPKP